MMGESAGKRRLLRVYEIPAEYGGSRSFWYQLARSGVLRCIRVGRALFVDRADLEQFLARHKVGGQG